MCEAVINAQLNNLEQLFGRIYLATNTINGKVYVGKVEFPRKIGERWLEHLSSKTGKKVICGADFMRRPRMLLEAKRRSLYKDMPVPKKWHEMYAEGKTETDYYWKLAKGIYK